MTGKRTAACLLLILCLLLGGCSGTSQPIPMTEDAVSVPVEYAQGFSMERWSSGAVLLTVQDRDRYLILPEGEEIPEDAPEDAVILQQPLDRIYLVATQAMDSFRQLDGIGAIRLSGTDAEHWYLPEARAAMENEEILYAGKYSAPDYELILTEDCDLAVYNTMVFHQPQVKEQLERLGVPVFVECSSYESDPLGRLEWVKVYGALLGKLEEAERFFQEKKEQILPILDQPETGKRAAFFYITSNHLANVRKGGDYVAKMISMAGGEYIFADLRAEDNALATMNLQLEAFYETAKEADVFIYNSTIDGELTSISQLLEKCPVLADCRAVETGAVWCTTQSLFQESMSSAELIEDMYHVFSGDTDAELHYLYQLEDDR